MESAPLFFAHHSKEYTQEFVLEVLRKLAPRQTRGGHPIGEEDYLRWLAIEQEADYRQPLGYWEFFIPRRNPLGQPREVPLFVYHILTQGPFEISYKKLVRIEAILREPKNWIKISCGPGQLSLTDAGEAEWFLSLCRRTLPLFESDFAFADVNLTIAKNADQNPRDLAWPIMIFGPGRIPETQKDHVRKSPAYKIDELETGHVWLQVSENPFTAKRSELKALADHLGLKTPR